MENKVLYANSVTLRHSVYDVQMEFFINVCNADNQNKNELISDIRLSPQLAKEMIGLLTQVVDSYEQAYGEIPVKNE